MTTASSNFNFDPQMQLSADQQDLLMAALRSNQASGDSFAASSDMSGAPIYGSGFESASPSNGKYVAPSSLNENDQSPEQFNRSSSFEVDDSPYQYDFDLDGNYDFDTTEGENLIGPLPTTGSKRASGDLHDKRKSESNIDGERKRHEGDEQKQPKKPGRKPLTTEPTTKRKAQNRAAQRAFRERKEKHLKDLETKVDDLEKMSESANHENSLLRAQVERLQSEIKDYRKRLQLANNSNRGSWGSGPTNTFSFDFPTFGPIPNSVTRKVSDSATFGMNGNISPVSLPRGSNASQTFDYTAGLSNGAVTGSPNSQRDMQSPNHQKTPDSVALDDLFTSSIMEGPYATPPVDFSAVSGSKHGSRMNSVNSVSSSHRGNSVSSADFSASPSASSQSHTGPSSSCGTSPEPSALSPPNSKLESTLNTINEEHADENKNNSTEAPIKTALTDAALSAFSPANGLPNDWLAPQNGISTDPNLFGDYRDPTLDIFSTNYDNFLNNEAFMLPDFGANPFNSDMLQEAVTVAPTTEKEMAKKSDNKQTLPRNALNCNKLWDKVSAMTETEDLDIDGLCSELRAKAKCTENGLVVADSDFHSTVEQFRRK